MCRDHPPYVHLDLLSSLGGHEHVAHASHRADRLVRRRILLDFAPDARDAQVHRAVEHLHLAMADRLQQPVARQRPIGILGEYLQQVELGRRQHLFAAVDIDQRVLLEVEHAAAHAHPRARGRHHRAGGPAQHALDAGQQLARVEGLRQVIVGAGLQPNHPVDRVARRRHHDDADPAALLAQPARHRKAVLARQPDIEQHQRRHLALDQTAQADTGLKPGDPIAVPCQVIEQKLALGRLVLDHDDMLTLVHLSPARHPSIRRGPRDTDDTRRRVSDTQAIRGSPSMSAMNQVDIARIDPQRVAQVVTNRLVAIPTMPKLLALPIILAAATALYRGIAPLWMFGFPTLIYLIAVWGSWRVTVGYERHPGAVSLRGWRWLYTATAVPTSFASGLMGGLFATLPADQERTLWTFALCLMVGWTPSRSLHGPTFLLSGLALLLPVGAMLVLHDGSRDAIGLAAIAFGFLAIINLFSYIECKRMREQIARDLAAADLSQTLDQAHRDVAVAEETMRTMLGNISDGAMLYERDGRWIYQNEAMARLHDLPDEMLKTLPTFADIIRYRALRGDYGPIETLPGGLEEWLRGRIDRFGTTARTGR